MTSAKRTGAIVVKQIAASDQETPQQQGRPEKQAPRDRRTAAVVPRKPLRAKEAISASLYEQRHRLYDDEQILDNIKHAEQLKQLLTQYKVKDVDELHAVIEKHAAGSQLLPVTQQIIASLGITSVEEWKKALEDKDLAALFAHESTPTQNVRASADR